MLKIKQHLETIKYWLFEISKHNDNSTRNMVTNGRKALRGSFAEVEKYIDDLEN